MRLSELVLRPLCKPPSKIRSGSSSGIKRKAKSTDVLTPAKVDPTTLEYKEFDDVPLKPRVKGDTYDYGPDGATTTWFEDNTNFRDVLASRSMQDQRALDEFSTGHFMLGQQYSGFSHMYSYEQDYVRSYDSMLDRSEVRANVKVTRFATPELLFGGGVRTTTLTELQAMKGSVITSKANLSTAAAKVGLGIGDADKTVEYKIHIPAGSRGAGMYIGVHGVHAWGERQREFMLNRDTKWLVGDSRYDAGRKVFEVDLYFDGRNPHDYS